MASGGAQESVFCSIFFFSLIHYLFIFADSYNSGFGKYCSTSLQYVKTPFTIFSVDLNFIRFAVSLKVLLVSLSVLMSSQRLVSDYHPFTLKFPLLIGFWSHHIDATCMFMFPSKEPFWFLQLIFVRFSFFLHLQNEVPFLLLFAISIPIFWLHLVSLKWDKNFSRPDVCQCTCVNCFWLHPLLSWILVAFYYFSSMWVLFRDIATDLT